MKQRFPFSFQFVLVAFVLGPLAGCATLENMGGETAPPEPEDVEAVEIEPTEEAVEPQAAPPEPEVDEPPKEEGRLQWDEAGDADRPARLDDRDDVETALKALHRIAGGAFMGEVMDYVQGRAELGERPEMGQHACPDGGYIQFRWDDSPEGEASRAVHYEFNDCRGQFRDSNRLRLDGTYVRSFVPVDDGDRVDLEFDITGEDLEAEGRSELALKGRKQIQHPSEGGFLEDIPYLEVKLGGRYTALLDFRRERLPGDAPAGDNDFGAFSTPFLTNYQGTLINAALEGRLEVSTPEPLVEQYPMCAASGYFRLESERVAEIRYGRDTGVAEAVTLEVDNQRIAGFGSCSDFAAPMGFGPGVPPAAGVR